MKLLAGIYDISPQFVPSLREEERRRRTRMVQGALAALAFTIGLSAFGAWQWHEASRQFVETTANSIWNELQFQGEGLQPAELDALWQLATSEEPVRRAFLRKLSENPTLVSRFDRQAGPALRAVGLKSVGEEEQAALGTVLNAVDHATRLPTWRDLRGQRGPWRCA